MSCYFALLKTRRFKGGFFVVLFRSIQPLKWLFMDMWCHFLMFVWSFGRIV